MAKLRNMQAGKMRVALALALAILCGLSGSAQTPAAPAQGDSSVEVDPIRCWWRTSAGAVRVGETFELALTCAVLENESVQVVPDESRLGSGVIQMAPFEVAGGSHPADLRSGLRRFFQYLYTLRIINPDAIGKDVKIPDLAIHYRVNSRVAANAALQGRDLTYFLPQQWVRVASMVPADTVDIRDAGGEHFATSETLVFRAGVLEISAITLIALGSLMVIVVLIQLARSVRRPTQAGQRQISTYGVLKAAASQLADVQREREQQGWSPGLVDRALSAARVVAACAIGKPVSQRTVGAKTVAGAGRLIAPRGRRFLSARAGRAAPRALSSAVTVPDLTQALSRAQEGTQPDRTRLLEQLRDALSTFSATQYGRGGAGDNAALDGALTSAAASAAALKSEQMWPRPWLRRRPAEEPVAESEA